MRQKHWLLTEYHELSHISQTHPAPNGWGQTMWLVPAKGPWEWYTSFVDGNIEEPVRDPPTLPSPSKSINRMLSSLHLWVKAKKENALGNCQTFLEQEINLYMLSHWDFGVCSSPQPSLAWLMRAGSRKHLPLNGTQSCKWNITALHPATGTLTFPQHYLGQELPKIVAI